METESAGLNPPLFNRSKKKYRNYAFSFAVMKNVPILQLSKDNHPKSNQTKMIDSHLALLQAMESDLFDSYYLMCDGSADPYAFHFQVQLAIYVHCMEYHPGQFSDKYKIICYLKRLGFELGQWEYAREDETSVMMYETLNEKYGNK